MAQPRRRRCAERGKRETRVLDSQTTAHGADACASSLLLRCACFCWMPEKEYVMACNHTFRDYSNMTVEEICATVAADGKIQSTFAEDNYRDGALACSVRGAFVGNEEK